MGLFDSLKRYAFELLMLIVIFVTGLVLTIYASQAHSQCKKALNGKHGDIPDEDKQKYEDAQANLQIIIWVGWTIVGLSALFFVILVVVSIFLGPEELGAAATTFLEETFGPEIAGFITEYGKTAYELGKDIGSKLKTINADTKRAKNGLYFRAAFGGVITQLIFAAMLIVLFVLGVYAALASVKLSHTSGKYGYEKAKIAALLGIIPFSIFFVWFIADLFYRHSVNSRIKHEKEEVIRETSEVKQQMAVEGRDLSPRRAAPSIPQQDYTPRRSAPPTPQMTHREPTHRYPPQPSTTPQSSLANSALNAGSAFLQSPEGQKALESTGKAVLGAIENYFTS